MNPRPRLVQRCRDTLAGLGMLGLVVWWLLCALHGELRQHRRRARRPQQ